MSKIKNLMDGLLSIDSYNIYENDFKNDIVFVGNIDEFTQEDVKRLVRLRYYVSKEELE